MSIKSVLTSVGVCLLVSSAANAQILQPGTFVATTLNAAAVSAATSSVQVVDPFAKTAKPLKIAGFPGAGNEGPDAVMIESVVSMLLGTRIVGANGNIYRATLAASGWAAKKLNTTPTRTVSVAAISKIGNTIYFVGAASVGTTGTSALILSIPSGGGPVKVYVDVGKAGATGLGNAMAAVGNVLHYFTFDSSTSTTSFSEHWMVDTSAATPKAVKVGAALPKSVRLTNNNFAAVQADYDAVNKVLVIGGVAGDVLWRTTAGKNLRHVGSGAQTTDALALNTDTGTVGIGDRAAHYEDLRCDGVLHKPNFITMPAPVTSTTRVSNLAYFSAGPARFSPIGDACKPATGNTPCSYITALPKNGATVTFTVEATKPKAAALMVGVRQVSFPFLGCSLYTSLDILVPATKVTATGAEVGPLKLPAGTGFLQWILVDGSNNLIFSDGRKLVSQ